jgi:hypothetical protein
VTLYQTDYFAEHFSGHHLNLVEDQQAPVDILNLLHLSLLVFISSALERNHAVSWNQDARLFKVKHFITAFASEAHRQPIKVGPLTKLLAPLLHRHVWAAKDNCRFFYMTWGHDSSQCFARAAWQDNDARPSPTVAKHFRQSLLLVVSNDCCRLHLNLEIRCEVVFLEVILLNQRQLLGLAVLFNFFYVFTGYLELSFPLYSPKLVWILCLPSRYFILVFVPLT